LPNRWPTISSNASSKAPTMPWCSPCVTWEPAMNNGVRKLSRQYAVGLRNFMKGRNEAMLAQAYELGRDAIARGLGVLDMARIHEAALLAVLKPEDRSISLFGVLNGAAAFLMETLSPFEATHRGFREANLKLKSLNTE